MTVQDHVVAEARRWIGTPYGHQSACLGAGADCLGLLRGVWRALYGDEPEALPPYSRDWDEPQGQEQLWQAATRHLTTKTLDQAAVGDVLLFRMRQGAVAKHLGLQSAIGAAPRFIHAYSGHGVVETALSQPWQRRIVARFGWPETPRQI
jgi:NlpC/P60 family putative phage cell wall peptidase